MDVWRYSDWWGLGDQLRNSQKHIWHWREWIVESLNSDTPYDKMVRLMLAKELFTFVTSAPVTTPTGEAVPVAGTNNEAERTLRKPASARDTGRTNKTMAGARRRTIHTSVLDSLRCYLPEFTLSSVISEVQRWLDTGHSCFARMLKRLRLPGGFWSAGLQAARW